MRFLQENHYRLLFWLIAGVFVLKGVILSLLFPAFQQPDEPIHYATVQQWAESEKTDALKKESGQSWTIDPNNILSYHLTEETVNTASTVQFDEVKFQKENKIGFSSTSVGPKENYILSSRWKQYTDHQSSNTSRTNSFYYWIGARFDSTLSNNDIFTRLLASRLLSVILGLLTVLLTYQIAQNIGLSKQASLLIMATTAFQPMLATTAAQVNIDIALIFSFSLFLSIAIWILKDGLTWKNTALAIGASILGAASKGPGLVLFIILYPLLAWGIYQKWQWSLRKFITSLIIATLVIAGLGALLIPKSYLQDITNTRSLSKFDSPLESISAYLDKTLRQGELRDTSLSYWGNFGWLDTPIQNWILTLIVLIEIIGFTSVLLYLFLPLLHHRWPKFLAPWKNSPSWLPERKYLILFLGMIIALQLTIRFYDWRIFDTHGQILIGQPGRYFLPNIISHLLLVVIGLGILLRTQSRFLLALKGLALGMILLQFHAIINIILPRYYL